MNEELIFSLVGSCVTRDASEIGTNPLPGPRHYFSRTKVRSIVSEATPLRMADVTLESGFQRRAIHDDFTKRVASVLPQIDHPVVIDLIDERFPLFRSAHGYVTMTPYVKESGINVADFVRLDDDHDLDSAGPFASAAERLSGLLPADQIVVVHRAMWATQDAGGAELEKPTYIRRSNEWLAQAYDVLGSALGERCRFVQPAAVHCRADPGHKWGPAPFHYVREYYDDLSAQIRDALGSS